MLALPSEDCCLAPCNVYFAIITLKYIDLSIFKLQNSNLNYTLKRILIYVLMILRDNFPLPDFVQKLN